jgi:hypothetical protein
MATDASIALGAPQLAGTFVNPKGYARRVTATAVGGVVGAAVASATTSDQSELPHFGRVGYVAVTDNEVALIKTKSGLFRMKVSDEVLARRERSEISLAELKRGKLTSGLTIEFHDGVVWAFDVPKANQRAAKQVIEALGGAIN